MLNCAICHHPYDLHMLVAKHGLGWPCTVDGCKCDEFTLRELLNDRQNARQDDPAQDDCPIEGAQ